MDDANCHTGGVGVLGGSSADGANCNIRNDLMYFTGRQ